MSEEEVKKKAPEENQDSEADEKVEKINVEASKEDLIETTGAEIEPDDKPKPIINVDTWNPKTQVGKDVKKGLVTNIAAILDAGQKILEIEVIDALLPDLSNELLMIGQAKGKFGGGQRRIFKQTQRKTREGNKPSFSTFAVVGNKNGYVGIGYGKSKETVPAREKALRTAKLSLFKIARGCGSWECKCKGHHSIPYAVSGKCGSVKITLKPAPRGKGLVIEKECMKILDMAGIKDVWAKSSGQTKVKSNLIKACIQALSKLTTTKITPECKENTGYVEGVVQ